MGVLESMFCQRQLGTLPNFFPISVCCQLLLNKFLLCCVEVLKSHIEQAAEKSELFGGGGFNVCQDQLSVSQLLADNCLLCCFCNQKKSKYRVKSNFFFQSVHTVFGRGYKWSSSFLTSPAFLTP